MRAADLEAELAEAQRLMRCDQMINGVPWGIASVEPIGRDLYVPRPDDGIQCLLLGVIEHGELVDLAAIGPKTRQVRTRTGWAAALGEDAIDRVRWAGSLAADAAARGYPRDMRARPALRLLDDPLAWVMRPHDSAYLIDWSRLHFALADVPDVACSTAVLAARLRRQWPIPRMPRLHSPPNPPPKPRTTRVAAKPVTTEVRHAQA